MKLALASELSNVPAFRHQRKIEHAIVELVDKEQLHIGRHINPALGPVSGDPHGGGFYAQLISLLKIHFTDGIHT